MSWILVGTGVALDIGSRIYQGGVASGWGDQDDKIDDAKTAAHGIFAQQKLLAGRAKGVATGKALTTRDFSMNKLGFGARASLTDLGAEGNKMIAGANMAGGSMYTTAVDKKKKSVYDTYKSSQEYVKDSYSLAIDAAEIAEETSVAQAQKTYQDTITKLDDRPDDFWEGFFT